MSRSLDDDPSGARAPIVVALWLTLGAFGGHRYFLHRPRSATAMLGLAIVQAVLVLGTFGNPLEPPWIYYFWPPFAASENVRALIGLAAPDSLTSDVEEVLVRPFLWLLTTPSLVLSTWLMLDGIWLLRWRGQPPASVPHRA